MGRKPKAPGKKRWGKRIVLAGVGLAVLGIGSVELTSQNWFCNSCHIMGPFYDSWKVSTHQDVHCVECHIPPGVDSFVAAKLNGLGQVVDDVLNRTSTKPSASVSAMACSRSGCHSVERLAEKAIKTESYHFDHGSHFGKEYFGIKIDCTTCHSHVAGDEHFTVNTNTCILCHMAETAPVELAGGGHGGGGAELMVSAAAGPRAIRMAVRRSGPASADEAHPEGTTPSADCRVCHDPPLEEFEYRGLQVNHEEFLAYGASCDSCHHGVTATPAAITDAACLSCHTFGVERAASAEEIHRVHAEGEHKVECFSCHGMPEHGPEAQALNVSEFDCLECHTDQHTIQRETYLWAGAAAPQADGKPPASPMFMAHVDCTGCHVATGPFEGEMHNGAQVVRASAEGCDACHQPGLGEQMIPLWQNSTRGLHEQVVREIEKAAGAPLEPPALALVDEAKSLAELVRMDGSWGVHNPRYTQQLLEQAREKVRAAVNGAAGPEEEADDSGGGS
jgi:nitrate/TMAO reductase-like tetraheme cytochrome c subunit